MDKLELRDLLALPWSVSVLETVSARLALTAATAGE